MSLGHSSNEDFFARVAELFEESKKKDHGSVHLTQKRMSYGAESPESSDSSFSDLAPSTPLPILLRATNAKTDKETRKHTYRISVSTIVQPDHLEAFFTRYAEICKAGMAGLKKRDRSKGKKKLKAKKKKGGAGTEELRKS